MLTLIIRVWRIWIFLEKTPGTIISVIEARQKSLYRMWEENACGINFAIVQLNINN